MSLRFRQPIVMIWPVAFTLCGLLVHVALSVRISSEPVDSESEPQVANTDLILLSHGAHAGAEMREVEGDGPTIISALTSEELAADAAASGEIQATTTMLFAPVVTKALWKLAWNVTWQENFADWIWDFFDGSIDEGDGMALLPIDDTEMIPSSWVKTEKNLTLVDEQGWWWWWGPDLSVEVTSRCWFNGTTAQGGKTWAKHCGLFHASKRERYGHFVHVYPTLISPEHSSTDSCTVIHYTLLIEYGHHWVYSSKEFHHVTVDGCTGAQKHYTQSR